MSTNILSQYTNLSKDDLIQKLVDLENDFKTFSKESKELEDFLDQELNTTTADLNNKKAQLINRDKELAQVKLKLIESTKQITRLNETINTCDINIKSLKKKIVDLEIHNDSLESILRIKINQLEAEMETKNECLEHIAYLENELNLTDKTNKRFKDLKQTISSKTTDYDLLFKRYKQLERITKLLSLKHSIKISKFCTPPIEPPF